MPPPSPRLLGARHDRQLGAFRILFPCDVDEAIFVALARSILPCRVSS
ncbi:hypothetical protein CKAH01_01019 [Colletotrichum kahawae]|uniref:Uncharacterized protein n=1 Tax=Colletotrichum kahawae TaxID=34407 RepID=A0AAD9YJZ3_COLKA|nr:hypothetical protein CKAH01_01019 [Colletotrichum kahawae]